MKVFGLDDDSSMYFWIGVMWLFIPHMYFVGIAFIALAFLLNEDEE